MEEVVRDARVLDRGRNGEADGGEAGVGELALAENAGCDGDRFAEASEAAECDREDMGTIRFWRLWFEA